MTTMTKTALVAKLSEKTQLRKSDVSALLDELANTVTETLKSDDPQAAVILPGIGKISVRKRAERTVRNPATGETSVKPADTAVRVTISKALKDSVNA